MDTLSDLLPLERFLWENRRCDSFVIFISCVLKENPNVIRLAQRIVTLHCQYQKLWDLSPILKIEDVLKTYEDFIQNEDVYYPDRESSNTECLFILDDVPDVIHGFTIVLSDKSMEPENHIMTFWDGHHVDSLCSCKPLESYNILLEKDGLEVFDNETCSRLVNVLDSLQVSYFYLYDSAPSKEFLLRLASYVNQNRVTSIKLHQSIDGNKIIKIRWISFIIGIRYSEFEGTSLAEYIQDGKKNVKDIIAIFERFR